MSARVVEFHQAIAAVAEQVLDEFGLDEFGPDDPPEVNAALVARTNDVRRRFGAPVIAAG